jgi:hypothetical protein
VSLIHAEYLKITRRKLYPVMAGVLGIVMALVGLLFYVVLPALPEAAGGGVGVPQRPDAFIYGAQQVAGQAWWFAVILATAVFGAEVASTVWATSLTRDSRKVIHIAARFLVLTIATWLAFLIGTAIWAFITLFFAEGSGSPTAGEWFGLLWKFLAIAAAWTSIGLGAVGLSRSIAVAMGVALGISFVDSIVAPFVDVYEGISLTAASNGIFGVGGDGAFSVFIPGGDMSVIHALAVMAGWSLLGLGVMWWGLQRRDA